MKRALLILKDRLHNEIHPILPLVNYQTLAKIENGVEALRMAQRLEPDLIIAEWDISGYSPLDLLQNLVHSNICPIVLVLEEKYYTNLHLAVKTNVHQILIAPIRATDVISGLIQAQNAYERELQNMKEIRKLNEELKTRKLVYQAVLILISDGHTEEAAYAAIRSEAMTSRKTLRSVANDVIKGTWRP